MMMNTKKKKNHALSLFSFVFPTFYFHLPLPSQKRGGGAQKILDFYIQILSSHPSKRNIHKNTSYTQTQKKKLEKNISQTKVPSSMYQIKYTLIHVSMMKHNFSVYMSFVFFQHTHTKNWNQRPWNWNNIYVLLEWNY